jgi:hypothetical protein
MLARAPIPRFGLRARWPGFALAASESTDRTLRTSTRARNALHRQVHPKLREPPAGTARTHERRQRGWLPQESVEATGLRNDNNAPRVASEAPTSPTTAPNWADAVSVPSANAAWTASPDS